MLPSCRTAAAAFLAAGVLSAASCAAPAPLPPQAEFVLGTVCSVNLFEGGTPEAYREVFARLRGLEDLLSANKDGTEVDAVNRAAGLGPVKVGPDALAVARSAMRYAGLSGGAFDPTIGPLVKLWGIGSDDANVPPPEAVRGVLPLIAAGDLKIDEAAGTLFLARPGMRLDFGAIAKGYAADEAAKLIRARGIKRAIVDLGGNVLALGSKGFLKPWRVGVQDPAGVRGGYLGILEISDRTMVTSGVYERFLEADGKRYHHILSTKDGYPIENGLVSVTIVAASSTDADALSTSCFALGPEAGMALAESLPGIEAIFVDSSGSVRVTEGLKKDFKLTSPDYRLAP